ncbi:hypothetical protein LTR66_004584 [Elasticomyces elasticus]|nr:hypothetical protein LTR66_004584 [Elasticomyces elasticus]
MKEIIWRRGTVKQRNRKYACWVHKRSQIAMLWATSLPLDIWLEVLKHYVTRPYPLSIDPFSRIERRQRRPRGLDELKKIRGLIPYFSQTHLEKLFWQCNTFLSSRKSNFDHVRGEWVRGKPFDSDIGETRRHEIWHLEVRIFAGDNGGYVEDWKASFELIRAWFPYLRTLTILTCTTGRTSLDKKDAEAEWLEEWKRDIADIVRALRGLQTAMAPTMRVLLHNDGIAASLCSQEVDMHESSLESAVEDIIKLHTQRIACIV